MEELQRCENYEYGRCSEDRAEYVIDPYDEDVNGVETWRWLCQSCVDESAASI